MSQAAPTRPRTKRSSIFDHPLGFWFFFCGGCAERCSYYGMRAILLLYMIRILEFEDGNANCHLFVFRRRLLPASVGGRFHRRPVPGQLSHDRLFLDPLRDRPGHFGRRQPAQHDLPVPVAWAVGPRQRHHQAEHLDADGLDLRPAPTGQIDPSQRRLRPVLRLDQHRLGAVDALRAGDPQPLRRRYGRPTPRRSCSRPC